MHPPRVHIVPDLPERPLPRSDVQVIGVDQGAVDVAQRCSGGGRGFPGGGRSSDLGVALSFSGALWVGNDTRPTGGTLTSLPPPTDHPACNETCPGPTRPDAPASGNTATPAPRRPSP